MANLTGVNQKLVESLAQIIAALTEEERSLLEFQIQRSTLSNEVAQEQQVTLLQELEVGLAQLDGGQSAAYDESSQPMLLERIRERGQQRLTQRES